MEEIKENQEAAPETAEPTVESAAPEATAATAAAEAAPTTTEKGRGSRAEKVHVVFAQSNGLPHDVAALLRQALSGIGGRGGGRGNLAQGGSDNAAGLEAAVAAAARAVRERSGA